MDPMTSSLFQKCHFFMGKSSEQMKRPLVSDFEGHISTCEPT